MTRVRAWDDATERALAFLVSPAGPWRDQPNSRKLQQADRQVRNAAIITAYKNALPIKLIAQAYGLRSWSAVACVVRPHAPLRQGKRDYNPAADAAAREWLSQRDPKPLSMHAIGQKHGVNRFTVAGYIFRLREKGLCG